MPVYSYRCQSCGVQFDRHQRFSDDPLVVCPECNEPSLQKLIQPVGIVFKGSGFYVTDNRGASNGSLESSKSSSKSEKSEPGSKAEKKVEDKGEAKSKDD